MIQQLLAQQQMPGAQGAVWRPPDHPAWYERLMGAPPQLAEKIPPGYARQPPINFGEASQLPPPSAGMNALPETPSPPPQLIEKVPPGYQRRLPQPPAVNEPVQLPPPPRGINQPPPAGQRPMPSTQRYEQMLGARPELPTPRLWQRIAAGAVGGLGGYVNAAGRTRIDPEAINQAATNIQYPGYGAKMEAWRSDVELAKEQAAIEQQRADREMKQQQMESEIAARAAQAEADSALAESRRVPKVETPRPPSTEEAYWVAILSNPNSPEELRTQATQRLAIINVERSPSTPSPPRTEEAMLVEILRDSKASEAQKAQAQSRLNIINAQRREPKSLSGSDAQALNAKKNMDLSQIDQEIRAEVEGLDSLGGADDATGLLARRKRNIVTKYAREAQKAQQAYEKEIQQATGGRVKPFDMYSHVMRAWGFGTAPGQLSAPTPVNVPPQRQASSGPSPGAVEDGYRFKGGDPADPNSWEAMQ